MPACVRCGSRNINFRFTIFGPVMYMATGQKPVKCPHCGWKGYLKHTGKASWMIGASSRRRKYGHSSADSEPRTSAGLAPPDEPGTSPALVRGSSHEPNLELLDQELQRQRDEEAARRAARAKEAVDARTAARGKDGRQGVQAKAGADLEGTWPPHRRRSGRRKK